MSQPAPAPCTLLVKTKASITDLVSLRWVLSLIDYAISSSSPCDKVTMQLSASCSLEAPQQAQQHLVRDLRVPLDSPFSRQHAKARSRSVGSKLPVTTVAHQLEHEQSNCIRVQLCSASLRQCSRSRAPSCQYKCCLAPTSNHSQDHCFVLDGSPSIKPISRSWLCLVRRTTNSSDHTPLI